MSNTVRKPIHCHTEYDSLEHVVVALPEHMAITEVINETQNYYLQENINIDIAVKQHKYFIDILKAQGAVVEELDLMLDLNEQVFTRDIGFVIGEKLFVSYMSKDIRKKEVAVLMEWLEERELPFEKIELPTMEGGDVIIDGDTIWVGVSGRTSLEAIKDLQSELPNYTVSAVHLRDDILHLDCVFNVISEDTALIYPEAFHEKTIEQIKKHYKLIEVTKEEQFSMGPNVLAIGGGKLISLPENERLNNELTKVGFQIIEVPFSEIIKSGGSYRCCTLPLLRGKP